MYRKVHVLSIAEARNARYQGAKQAKTAHREEHCALYQQHKATLLAHIVTEQGSLQKRAWRDSSSVEDDHVQR